jgi:hypothetical protein
MFRETGTAVPEGEDALTARQRRDLAGYGHLGKGEREVSANVQSLNGPDDLKAVPIVRAASAVPVGSAESAAAE